MRYSVDIPDNIESCIYKLYYGDKYIIEKCKNLPVHVSKLMNGLNCFVKNTPNGRDENNLAYKFFNYVLWNHGYELRLEVIFEEKNPYKLLKREQLELWGAKDDENCLNKTFEAYIPMHTQVNGQKSWINRGYYLNFCIWRKKNRPPQKEFHGELPTT